MAEWIDTRQEFGEDVTSYMFRVQNMGEKAFAGFPDANKQKLAVFAFCRGMQDNRAAQLVMVNAKDKGHKALKTVISLVGRASLQLSAAPTASAN